LELTLAARHWVVRHLSAKRLGDILRYRKVLDLTTRRKSVVDAPVNDSLTSHGFNARAGNASGEMRM
jgi:hypothetical protein